MGENIILKDFSVSFQTSQGEVKAVRGVNTVFESGKVTGMISVITEMKKSAPTQKSR